MTPKAYCEIISEIFKKESMDIKGMCWIFGFNVPQMNNTSYESKISFCSSLLINDWKLYGMIWIPVFLGRLFLNKSVVHKTKLKKMAMNPFGKSVKMVI